MAWTTRTHKTVNDPTRISDINATIDNENDLDARIEAMAGSFGVPNGSFESDENMWDVSDYASGSHAITTTAGEVVDGGKAIEVTQASSGGSNGGSIVQTHDDYLIPCAAGQGYYLGWYLKCSAANVSTSVEVLFYDEAGSYVSGMPLLTDTSTNPTSYAKKCRSFVVPASCMKMRVKFVLGVQGGNSGWFLLDGVKFFAIQDDEIQRNEEEASGNSNVTIQPASWTDRIMNYERITDKYGTFTNGTNQITINLPGKYFYEACSASASVLHKLRVYNVTDGTVLAEGSPGSGRNQSRVFGTFSLTAGSKVVKLQDRTLISDDSGGQGSGLDGNELYSSLYLRRIGD
jgi:hypothetical protein